MALSTVVTSPHLHPAALGIGQMNRVQSLKCPANPRLLRLGEEEWKHAQHGYPVGGDAKETQPTPSRSLCPEEGVSYLNTWRQVRGYPVRLTPGAVAFRGVQSRLPAGSEANKEPCGKTTLSRSFSVGQRAERRPGWDWVGCWETVRKSGRLEWSN